MLPTAIIALTLVLATMSKSTVESVYQGEPGEVMAVKVLDHVNESLHSFKDMLHESLNVSRKCREDVENLTNKTKRQLEEQEIVITTLKDDLQRMGSRDASQALYQLKSIIFALVSEFESVTSLVVVLKEKVEDSDRRGVQLKEYVEQLNDEVKDQSNQLAESQRRNMQLAEGMKELNNTVEFLNNLLEASNSCKQQDNVKKLVQGFDQLVVASSLDKGLGNLLDNNTVAGSQLQKVLQTNETPLWSIGFHGHVELASLLLSGGMPVDKVIDSDGDHMLHAAARGGHLQMARLLLFHGADLDAKRSRGGYTPLMTAADEGQLRMVKYLVRTGADVSITGDDGKTALDSAQTGKHTAVSEFLESL